MGVGGSIKMNKAIEGSELRIIPDAGHSMKEEGISTKLVEYTDKYSDL